MLAKLKSNQQHKRRHNLKTSDSKISVKKLNKISKNHRKSKRISKSLYISKINNPN